MGAKTIEEFVAAVGREPVDDDMERANCVDAGKPGHLGCGWCEHNQPVFLCHACFVRRAGYAEVPWQQIPRKYRPFKL